MRPLADRRGLSLLESVVSLAIVGMTAVAALTAAGAELRAAERSRYALEAAALATERLDFLHLLTRGELMSLPDSVARGRFKSPLDGYRWTTTVTNRAKERGVYNVLIRIEWDGGAYTVHSALYRPPPVVAQQ